MEMDGPSGERKRVALAPATAQCAGAAAAAASLHPQTQVGELEALVNAACCRGVEPARCRDIISDAVRRARRKGAMLQHLDSSLLLSTLEVGGWVGGRLGVRVRAGVLVLLCPLHTHWGGAPLTLRLPRPVPAPTNQPPNPQQAKSEIAGIADVTATNAEVMEEEMVHRRVRGWVDSCSVGD